MKYDLVSAEANNISLLIKYKLSTILDYANNISKEEDKKIRDYVRDSIMDEFINYKLIKVNDNIIGCLYIRDYDDGIIIDELYLEEEYRGKGIGTSIIKSILKNNTIVYLWVYKDNIKAINLYEKCGFEIIENTESRYKMKFTI